YTTVLALDEKHYEARFYLGLLYIHDELYEQAVETLTILLDRDPSPTGSVMYELSQDGSVSGMHTLTDRNDLVLYNRARAFRGMKNYDRALRDINRAVSLRPGRAAYLHEKALIKEATGDTSEALLLYDELLSADPNYTAALSSLTKLTNNTVSDPVVAISAYSKVLARDSSQLDAWANRGILYYNNAQYQEAEGDFYQAITLDSSRSDSWLNHGMALTKLQQYSPAVADFKSALQTDPANSSARLHLGNAYLLQRKYRQALAEYDRLLEYDSEHSGALFNKGIAYYNLGEKDMACQYLRRAAELGENVRSKLMEKACD
ncbi:MAG: tetratricopeptide repeat protein, partial [Cyclobacteriaceae bacterium]